MGACTSKCECNESDCAVCKKAVEEELIERSDGMSKYFAYMEGLRERFEATHTEKERNEFLSRNATRVMMPAVLKRKDLRTPECFENAQKSVPADRLRWVGVLLVVGEAPQRVTSKP